MTWNRELPLRRTTAWSGFAEAEPIPHRYGTTTGTALRHNASGTEWVWADHPVQDIRSVRVGDSPAIDWQWRNTLDSSGRPVAMIEFTEPPDSAPLCSGRGKIDPNTGALIETPATVILDVLRIAGIAVDDALLDGLRAETSGLRIAGTVDGGTPLSVLSEICGSIGAVFSPLHHRIAQIHPGGSSGSAAVHVIDGADPDVRISAECSADDIATRLLLEYDYADGTPRAQLELTQTDVAQDIARSVSLPWIAEARMAELVGSRMLQYASRPRWVYSASGLYGRVRPGDLLDITTRRVVGAAGALATVLRCSWGPETNRSSVTAADAWV